MVNQKRKMPARKSLPVRKTVKKKREYNLNTYLMMMNADQLWNFAIDDYVDNNKKKLVARFMKYFTSGTFYPKYWNDLHMLMTMVCVFNKQKDFLMNKIKELAPQGFYEFWNSIVLSNNTNELSSTNYVERVCHYMHNYEHDYSRVLEFFQKIKPTINNYFGPLQYNYQYLLAPAKKVPEEYFTKDFRENLLALSLTHNKDGCITIQRNIIPGLAPNMYPRYQT